MCVMDEVGLAVDKGYRILGIYEVYEYLVAQYDPETSEGGLFAYYINTLLKLNQKRVAILTGFETRQTKSDILSFWKREVYG